MVEVAVTKKVVVEVVPAVTKLVAFETVTSWVVVMIQKEETKEVKMETVG